MQDCSNSITNALELLQSCTKPSICVFCVEDFRQDCQSKTWLFNSLWSSGAIWRHRSASTLVQVMACFGAVRHQAITWTYVDFSSVRFCGIHLRAISQLVPEPLFCIMSLNIILIIVKLPHLLGSSELIWTGKVLHISLIQYLMFSYIWAIDVLSVNNTGNSGGMNWKHVLDH